MASPKPLRLAAVGDLHCTLNSGAELRHLFASAAEAADALLLCGDLTDYGLPEEAHVLAEALATITIPVVGVLGNHDYESGRQDEVRRLLAATGAHLLDGEACEIQGVGIAGAKGFPGGFGRYALGPWGENTIKAFVAEAVKEAHRLESALAKLRTPERVVLLHYAPIVATIQGEPLEISCFLGSSRLEEPLIRYPATAVFHGHAHRGSLEGRTVNGTPVYNVAKPLLQRSFPDRPAFRVLELTRREGAAARS